MMQSGINMDWWRTTQMAKFPMAYKDEADFDAKTDQALKGDAA